MQQSIKDLRSQVVREVCISVSLVIHFYNNPPSSATPTILPYHPPTSFAPSHTTHTLTHRPTPDTPLKISGVKLYEKFTLVHSLFVIILPSLDQYPSTIWPIVLLTHSPPPTAAHCSIPHHYPYSIKDLRSEVVYEVVTSLHFYTTQQFANTPHNLESPPQSAVTSPVCWALNFTIAERASYPCWWH